jgi:hypothetical protein
VPPRAAAVSSRSRPSSRTCPMLALDGGTSSSSRSGTTARFLLRAKGGVAATRGRPL